MPYKGGQQETAFTEPETKPPVVLICNWINVIFLDQFSYYLENQIHFGRINLEPLYFVM